MRSAASAINRSRSSLDRGDHGLDRLLAELLGAMRHAPVDELARIGDVRARLRALLHALFEVMQGEVRHACCSAVAISPLFRRWAIGSVASLSDAGALALPACRRPDDLDFWFDFASTYSYPAAMRIGPLAAAGRCRGALSAVPARTDLQGAGLDHVAVQSLSGEGPPHVARPRAAVRGPRPAVPAARSVSAEQPAGGARRAGRARRRLGRRLLPRGVPRAVRRRPSDRRRRRPSATCSRT